jgi:hypothetical protein
VIGWYQLWRANYPPWRPLGGQFCYVLVGVLLLAGCAGLAHAGILVDYDFTSADPEGAFGPDERDASALSAASDVSNATGQLIAKDWVSGTRSGNPNGWSDDHVAPEKVTFSVTAGANGAQIDRLRLYHFDNDSGGILDYTVYRSTNGLFAGEETVLAGSQDGDPDDLNKSLGVRAFTDIWLGDEIEPGQQVWYRYEDDGEPETTGATLFDDIQLIGRAGHRKRVEPEGDVELELLSYEFNRDSAVDPGRHIVTYKKAVDAVNRFLPFYTYKLGSNPGEEAILATPFVPNRDNSSSEIETQWGGEMSATNDNNGTGDGEDDSVCRMDGPGEQLGPLTPSNSTIWCTFGLRNVSLFPLEPTRLEFLAENNNHTWAIHYLIQYSTNGTTWITCSDPNADGTHTTEGESMVRIDLAADAVRVLPTEAFYLRLHHSERISSGTRMDDVRVFGIFIPPPPGTVITIL